MLGKLQVVAFTNFAWRCVVFMAAFNRNSTERLNHIFPNKGTNSLCELMISNLSSGMGYYKSGSVIWMKNTVDLDQ